MGPGVLVPGVLPPMKIWGHSVFWAPPPHFEIVYQLLLGTFSYFLPKIIKYTLMITYLNCPAPQPRIASYTPLFICINRVGCVSVHWDIMYPHPPYIKWKFYFWHGRHTFDIFSTYKMYPSSLFIAWTQALTRRSVSRIPTRYNEYMYVCIHTSLSKHITHRRLSIYVYMSIY